MLDAGYRFQLRAFLGQVFYHQLKTINASRLPGGLTSPTGCDLRLNDYYKMRLLIGHRSLSLLWDRLIGTVPLLTAALCDEDANCKCRARWSRMWSTARNAILSIGSELHIVAKVADLRERLYAVRNSVDYPAVRHAARTALDDVYEALTTSLEDHFLGPP
ncbi:hypothetical protein B0H19DRAFT_1266690 [Mycena capillaripes]|nr:hypothetical protein B0H19DRAFT_1266690 [Mycena capillaripes]